MLMVSRTFVYGRVRRHKKVMQSRLCKQLWKSSARETALKLVVHMSTIQRTHHHSFFAAAAIFFNAFALVFFILEKK